VVSLLLSTVVLRGAIMSRLGKPNRCSSKSRLLLACSIAGVVLVLVGTGVHGAGLSPDSVTYVSVARNLALGRGFVTWSGGVMTSFPPLYPMLLAAIAHSLGRDPLSLAHVVNAVAFGVTVYLAGLLGHRYLSLPTWWVWLGLLLVLVSKPLFYVSTYAWSEPLFIVLVLLFLTYLDSYLARGDTGSLVLVSCFAALACLARYIGVTLIASGAVAILLLSRDRLKARVVACFLFGFLSCLPLGLWMLRNYSLTGTFAGGRAPSSYNLLQTAWFTFRTLASWYVPSSASERPLLWLGLVGVSILVAGFCFGLRENSRKLRAALVRTGPGVLFTVVYSGFLVISATVVAFDKINSRLLCPIYVPFTLAMLGLAQLLVETWSQWLSSRLVNIVLIACVAVSVLNSIDDNITHGTRCFSEGLGYSAREWKESETLNYLQHGTLSKRYQVYSNAPDAIYILMGLPARRSPSRAFYNSPKRANSLSQLKGIWPEEGQAHLVWFNRKHRAYLFTPGDLERVANLEEIAMFDDGVVYFVSRVYGDTGDRDKP